MDANGISRTAPKILPLILFATLTAVLSGIAQPSYATLITFDNLVAPPCNNDDCETLIVDNQYAALGVTFSGAGLYSYAPSAQLVTPPNGLSDFYGPGMSIHFSGLLPTTVTLYVSSINQDSVGALATGPNGQVGSFQGDGWLGTEENSTPYHDKQFVTFSGGEISSIELGAFYNRRGSVIIDNLEFNSVPLPSGLSLLASAVGCLLLRKR